MFHRMILKLSGIGLALFCLAFAIPQSSFAVSIGIKLGSNETGSTMDPADVAGAPGHTQANWNNTTGGTGSLADGAVKDSTGAVVSGMTFSWESSGTYRALAGTSTNPDDKLNAGYLYTGTSAGAKKFTFSNVPLQVYDVIVYFTNDGTNRYTRIQVNGGTSYYVRNANWSRSATNMGAYAQAPYYLTQSAAQADTKGYSYLVIPSVHSSVCTITHQTYNANDGICAVQIVPAQKPMAISIFSPSYGSTIAMGSKLTVMADILAEGAMPKVTRMDLLIDGTLVQSKTNPAGSTSWTMEWLAAQGLQATGRATSLALVATTDTNTTFSEGTTINVNYDYQPYNVVTPSVTSATSGTVTALNIASWGGEEAWRAFDGIVNNVAGMNTDNTTGALVRGWWGINLGSAKTINSYQFTHWRNATAGSFRERVFKDWTLQGSTNGSTWTDIDTVTSMPLAGIQSRNLATTATFQYYKLNIKGLWDVPPIANTKSGYMETGEIQYLNLPGLIDTTAPAAPITDATMGQKITLSAKVTLATGKTVESVRFYSGPRLLGFGTDKGGGVYSLETVCDRMGDIPVFSQLVLTDGFAVNSPSPALITVTAVPVELSHFAAE